MKAFSVRPTPDAVQRHRASGVWRADGLVEDVFRWAERTPDAEAVLAFRRDGGSVTLTYRELAGWVERFAAALAELGISAGDVVSVQLPNWWQALALALACWRRGAVLASVMTTIRGRELERMLAAVEATVFVTTDRWDGYEHAATVAEMASRLPALRHRVVLGDVVEDGEIDFVQFFQEQPHPSPAPHSTDPDAVAVVLFTSGTTGEPKAALRTLNTLYAQVSAQQTSQGGTPSRLYTPQSLMHVVGLLGASVSFVTGGALLLVDRWQARGVAQLLVETAIEHVILVPSFLSELLAAVHQDGIRLPRLREITMAGTVASLELVAETREVLGLSPQAQWGMTEGGSIHTRPEDPPDWAARSIGRAGAGTEVELRAVVADGPVSDENPGRLMIRGGSVCLATMGRDTGTLRVLAEQDEGWYDTGDLAVVDGRGGYRLVGRASDRIGGAFMIPVADVENALRAHPDITDVAIVGHRADTEGCAVIVTTAPVSLPGMRAYLSGLGMTEWYWPTRVERVKALPRNHMGKVEKARLRAWLAGQAESPAPA
ncbi:AMP-binding protein [Amycolatopsis rhabdoformis]|uniref:AMP-binding protein n=1 Tax=Amycolatopsis rhabdoformis TaxID=1448059 RepID=A0ABZ1IEF0_9PSEU|nr:AMP-binding protein [Amycolatopsis rhabdoformis]WSE32111.1 AMP-binding protein [Amycolatopsis rhabdoformis]